MKPEHLVPLSRQAVAVIDAVRPLTGRGPLVFPNARHAHKPLSENAMGYLLNRAGYHSRHVPHGWRATFSTIMNERYRDDRYIIDLILAHAAKDKTESAYNRRTHKKGIVNSYRNGRTCGCATPVPRRRWWLAVGVLKSVSHTVAIDIVAAASSLQEA